MKQREFDRVANELFGEVLRPHGFSNEGSKHCTFHRKVSAEMYHIVVPNRGTRGTWYDVLVYPASPVCSPTFETRFPDSLGAPTACYLHHADGVGPTQDQFWCKYEEVMRRVFAQRARGAVLEQAIPYLDAIRTLDDMIPLITHKLSLGFALHHVGRVEEARPILLSERARFAEFGPSDPSLQPVLNNLNELLGDR